MNSHGLKDSIWAPHNFTKPLRQPGDWNCPTCGFSNFAFRTKCLQCTPAPPSPVKSENGGPQVFTSYHDRSPTRHPNSTLPEHILPSRKYEMNGLATSRWAPKRRRGQTSSEDIWTRVCLHICLPFHQLICADCLKASKRDLFLIPQASRPWPSIRSTALHPRHDTTTVGGSMLRSSIEMDTAEAKRQSMGLS